MHYDYFARAENDVTAKNVIKRYLNYFTAFF